MAAAAVHEQWGEHQQLAGEHVPITPDYVLQLTEPTETYLCHLNANVYGVQFVHFKIRAIIEGHGDYVLQEVGAGEGTDLPAIPAPVDDSSRFIQYHFGPGFLEYPDIGTTLTFTNGVYPLHNFRMIEKYYFRGTVLATYDFEMPFVIPNTRNSWEMIYRHPCLNDQWKQAIMEAPWEVKSDSFYFVNNQLIMHNRAEYNFSEHA